MTKAIDINKPLQLADGRKATFRRIAIGHPDCILVDVLGAIGGKMFYQETGKAYFGQLPDLQNVPEVAPKIDWTKPIEDSEGRRCYVNAGSDYHNPPLIYVVDYAPASDSGNFFDASGYRDGAGSGQCPSGQLRNVAEVTPALDFTKPLTTRDGLPVSILTTEGRGKYPVVGYVGDERSPSTWTLDGSYIDGGEESEDLVNVEPEPAVTTVYRTVRKSSYRGVTLGGVETSDRKEAERLTEVGSGWDNVVAFTLTDGKVTAAEIV